MNEALEVDRLFKAGLAYGQNDVLIGLYLVLNCSKLSFLVPLVPSQPLQVASS